jgi:hypothetical protein
MTYSITTPQGSISPADQVAQVQSNFAVYNNVFNENHVGLNAANQAKHATVIVENRLSDPGVTESLVVLYNKNAISGVSPSPGQPQLFCQIPQFLPNNIPNTGMQLTYNSVGLGGPIYYSFLPGGFLFYFGVVSDITLPIVLSPIPTRVIMASATSNVLTTPGTPTAPAVSVEIMTSPSIQLQIHQAGLTGAHNFTWMAIAES